jgi:L-lactate dehydrogenase complex protein LldG
VATREAFLASLRRSTPREVPRPELSALGVKYPDRTKVFGDVLASVGGVCVRVADRAAAHRALGELPVYRDAKRVVSLVPGVGVGNVTLEALADPHLLEGVDVSVLPGEIAVAENGAVWVDGAAFHHRVVFVVPQHLVLVVDAAGLVDDMHQAYARRAGRPIGYGLFISGPSKTADIEQALVIGAQGARSCTVLLVG